MTNPLVEQFKKIIKEFDKTITPLTESTADIKVFIIQSHIDLVNKMIEELKEMQNDEPICYCKTHPEHNCGITSNEALSDTISQLQEFKKYLEELKK